MIKVAHKIADCKPVFQAKFQEHILEHWQQIQQGKRYPTKSDFRPQNFPKYLSQLAIVAVDDNEQYTDRLTGTTVSEVLRLSTGQQQLAARSDQNIHAVVKTMLGQTCCSQEPMYFEGNFVPEASQPIRFSALVLPFSLDEKGDDIDALLLAFDFIGMKPVGALG
jgi:hypothetical protein